MAEHEHEQDLYGDELGMGGNMDDGQEIPVGSNGEDAQMGGQQAAGDDQQKVCKVLHGSPAAHLSGMHPTVLTCA